MNRPKFFRLRVTEQPKRMFVNELGEVGTALARRLRLSPIEDCGDGAMLCRFGKPLAKSDLRESFVFEREEGKVPPPIFLEEMLFRTDVLRLFKASEASPLFDYPAHIVVPKTRAAPEKILTDYRLVSIPCVVDCIDEARSECEVLFEDPLFKKSEQLLDCESVVIDARKVKGQQIFHLRDPKYLVVSAALAAKLDFSPFPDVVLEPMKTTR